MKQRMCLCVCLYTPIRHTRPTNLHNTYTYNTYTSSNAIPTLSLTLRSHLRLHWGASSLLLFFYGHSWFHISINTNERACRRVCFAPVSLGRLGHRHPHTI